MISKLFVFCGVITITITAITGAEVAKAFSVKPEQSQEADR